MKRRRHAGAGRYTGLAFDMGVPFALNHADVTAAPSPLNIQALWWNWQGGYKFMRVDMRTGAPRFVVTATRCPRDCACPNSDALAHCPRRLSTRLLLSRTGALIQASEERRLDQP